MGGGGGAEKMYCHYSQAAADSAVLREQLSAFSAGGVDEAAAVCRAAVCVCENGGGKERLRLLV